MKAVVKTAPGVGNVEVVDIREPSPPPGHVKIAVRAAGICGTDLHIYHDEFRSWPPVVLGHEVCGEIVEVGSNVNDFFPGDNRKGLAARFLWSAVDQHHAAAALFETAAEFGSH